MIVSVDFSPIFKNGDCRGEEKLTLENEESIAEDVDYEFWSPFGKSLAKCVMGEKTFYMRSPLKFRKASSEVLQRR